MRNKRGNKLRSEKGNGKTNGQNKKQISRIPMREIHLIANIGCQRGKDHPG